MLNLFRSAKQTLRLLGPDRRWRWLLLVAMAVGVAVLEAIGAMLIITLVRLVTEPSGPLDVVLIGDLRAVFPDIDRDTLLLTVAGIVGFFFVLRAAVIVVQAYVQGRMIHNAAARLSSYLVRGYLALPYLFHTKENSSKLVRNSFDSVTLLTQQVMMPIAKVFAQAFVVIGFVIVMLATAPEATLIAFGVLVPIMLITARAIHPRLKKLGRRNQAARAGSLKHVQQALGGVRDIKILGREAFFTRAFAQERRALARTHYVYGAVIQIPRVLIETALVLVIVILFVVAVVAGDSVEGLLSTIGLFAYAGLRLQPALREIVKSLNDLKFGSAVLDDLSADRERVDAALALERTEREGEPPGLEFTNQLQLSNVGFSYSTDSTPALASVDLTIRKGEFIGVCGPTGGGKSTLVDIIAGLLVPTGGQVQVDGANMADVAHWWQQQLGVVSQSVFLVDDTIRRNIALGQSDAEIDEDRLNRAIRRAQLDDVMSQLPSGSDTVVGERGIRLSGGQRQRVAIARAFYREPAVLILDEGTSALDTATETALVAAIDELKIGRTLIAVAHRITTVARADRIVVIEGGRISASGTYDELLDRSDLFRALAQ